MPHTGYTKTPTTTVLHETHCCGIGEIDYLALSATPQEALQAVYDRVSVMAHMPVFITFSGVVGTRVFNLSHDRSRKDDYGQAFANFITESGLGPVISTAEGKNWTKNLIKLWVWQPDYVKFFALFPKPQEPEVEVEVAEETNG